MDCLLLEGKISSSHYTILPMALIQDGGLALQPAAASSQLKDEMFVAVVNELFSSQ